MKKCLIVVDYQNDFVDGSLGFPEAVLLDEVMFTFDTHDEAYMDTQEGRSLPVAHCLKNTFGHALYGRVAEMIEQNDRRFEKHTFGSDELFQFLKSERYESIELAGVVSNICVISNAVLAKTAQPETPVLVDVHCTASNDAALNRAALDVMRSLQIQIIE